MGDIVAMAGFKDINIGETVADAANPEALPSIHIDEPTLSMVFHVNKSPFAGREGDFVTSRHIRARLMKEIENERGSPCGRNGNIRCIPRFRPGRTSSVRSH